MQVKYLLGLGLPLALSGALVTGCGQNGATGTNNSGINNSTAQSNAPENSSADESQDKTGAGKTDAMATAALSTKIDFSSTPSALPVGKAATWTLKVADAQSGAPVKDFTVVHDKLMHLIVVKKDLTWFNHIHPEHKGNGTFTVTTTLPTPGAYKLYADYTPKGKTQEVPSHEFSAGGVTMAATPQLVPDKMQGAWMTKKVVAHAEGEPGKQGGATYEVALMPMPMPIVAGQDSMLHFQVRDANGNPVKDLQPYLGAMGHCVILSSDTESYLHSHPVEGGAEHDMSKMGEMKHAAPPKSGGPDVMFHTNFPTSGLYKAWGQFKHKGQIITAAFVVDVGAAKGGASGDAANDEAHVHDESKPHAH
jgi:hypothetical protein